MAYAGPIAFPVIEGGTGDSSFTAYSVITGGTTSTGALQSVSGVGTSGQVLTSNGASALPTWQAASGGSGITTIDGDTGSATGSTVTFNGAPNNGSSVSFSASGAAVALKLLDSHTNVIIGNLAGNSSITASNCFGIGTQVFSSLTNGNQNCAFGGGCLLNVSSGTTNIAIGNGALGTLTTSSNNTAVGGSALQNIITGARNTALGLGAGSGYVGAESNNIVIVNNGSIGESNAIRIGTQGSGSGQQNTCYIAGIQGASISSGSPTPSITYCDRSDGQLVATAAVASSSATSTFGSLVVGTARQNTANYAILVNISIAVTAAASATITLGVGSTSTPTTNTVVASFSVAETVSFSAFVPSQYYCLVNTTGTITVGSITTQTCAIG